MRGMERMGRGREVGILVSCLRWGCGRVRGGVLRCEFWLLGAELVFEMHGGSQCVLFAGTTKGLHESFCSVSW